MIRVFALLVLLAGPALAQDDPMGFDSDPDFMSQKKKAEPRNPVSRMGLAVALAFDTTTWVEVGISSEPARAATSLIRDGFYRLELLQLIVMAKASGGKLPELMKKRTEGASLRSLAEELKLSYDDIYKQSEALAEGVDRRLEQFRRVRSDGAGK